MLRYPGSKARLAGRIVALMPPHHAYLEPFFGSGIVLLSKSRSATETVNDKDGRVVNFFTVLRDRTGDLADLVALTPYARDGLAETGLHPDPLEDARRFAYGCWASREGAPHRDLHFRVDLNGRALAATWARLPGKIVAAAERLRGVQIENDDALELVRRAQPGTLIYADPPYVGRELYGEDFTFLHHERLLAALRDHDGPVVLSGQESLLYDRALGDWRRETFDAKKQKNVHYDDVVWLKGVSVATA